MVGEIGRDRREFLYDMEWCDIVLIIRGYSRRNILMYQLQRITAYGAFHAFSGDPSHKGPEGWLPLYFDKYGRDEEHGILTQEEYDDLMADLRAEQRRADRENENRTEG